MISDNSIFAQVIVPAFHGAYASKASAVAIPSSCGAYVAPGVWKEFLCHNLGADTSLDPNIPVQGIHGNYYQWGRITPVANASTPAGAISGWNTASVANGAWTNASKTATDPCPAGYRVPSNAQWTYLANNNTVSRSGSWANEGNFTTAIHFGTSTAKTLSLPAAGYRSSSNGVLADRGGIGHYWSSTQLGGSSINTLYFSIIYAFSNSSNWLSGHPVRCVSE